MRQKNPELFTFFDELTNAACHIDKDPVSEVVAIVDSILDFDAAAGRTDKSYADMLIGEIGKNGWKVAWILETDGRAANLSGDPCLAKKLGERIAMVANIANAQKVIGKVFNADIEFEIDGSKLGRLYVDGDVFKIGNLEVLVMHTPICVTYAMSDDEFIGDALFLPDFGTDRADFPGGFATDFFGSIQRILALPNDTRLFLCRDYVPRRGTFFYRQTRVAKQKAANIRAGEGKFEEEFVDFRTKRDAQLAMPKLITPSILVK